MFVKVNGEGVTRYSSECVQVLVLRCLADTTPASPLDHPQPEIAAALSRFQSDLVNPCLTKTAKAKTTEAKLTAICKHLWTRLAKAPAHKQPAHAQFLTSALRPSGARRLDCLGIATAALALCRALAAADAGAQHGQHDDLRGAEVRVSDDHCWLSVPGGGAGGGPLHYEVGWFQERGKAWRCTAAACVQGVCTVLSGLSV